MIKASGQTVLERYQEVLSMIDRTVVQAGRDPSSVRLVVVTKGHPINLVQEIIDAGATRLGENYVDEAIVKINALTTGPRVEWHMIGHIQSRKVHSVIKNFHFVHSLDSYKLAQKFSILGEQDNKQIPVLLECNVSAENTKFGWQAWDEPEWSLLAGNLYQVTELEGIEIRGLMCMAPYSEDPEQARPFFQRLRRLRDYLAGEYPNLNWEDLSMGMSGDFITAIQEGATILRIGTAILGARGLKS